MFRERSMTDEELAAAHAAMRRDLDRCRTALRKELRRAGPNCAYVPPLLSEGGHPFSRSTLKRMPFDERVEYFLSRRPMRLLEAHVGSRGAARFRALWAYHIPLARRFARKTASALHLWMDDVVSNAYEGLMIALARHDPSRGAFSTYAKHWVKHEIGRAAIRYTRPMRISNEILRRARLPDTRPEEAVVTSYRCCGLDESMSAEELGRMLGVTPFRAWEGLSVQSLQRERHLPDPAASEAFRTSEAMRDGRWAMDCLDRADLSVRERAILLERLEDDGPSYKEIGGRFDLSRERVRQVSDGALRKVRKLFFGPRAPREDAASEPQGGDMTFIESREKERFSLDDPDAARKLVENLDARKVRLAFSEMCWHFRCTEYDEKMRLRNFLIELDSQGLVLEVLPNLYCRPALSGGSSDAKSVRKAAKKIARIRRARRPKAAPVAEQATPSLAEPPHVPDDGVD